MTQNTSLGFCFFLLVLVSCIAESSAKSNKVCVYTIAKNEAKQVARFAESAKKADLVLVVDTGSQDNTVQLLKQHNISVVEKTFTPWRFDAARNFALNSLPEDCEICVWQDLDEVFTPDDWADRLRTHFADDKVNNVLVHFVYPNAFDYWRYKAHRRHGFYYKYAVHEIFTAEEGVKMQSVYADDITVLHLVDSTKARNYIPLLEISIAEFPDEVPSHTFWLARDYYFTEQFEKSIQTFEKYLNLKTAQWEAERGAACTFIAEAFWRLSTVDINSNPNLLKFWIDQRTEDDVYLKNSKLKSVRKPDQYSGDKILKEEVIDRIETWFVRGTQEASGYRDPLLALANWHILQFDYAKGWDRVVESLFIVEKDEIYLVTERAWTNGPYFDLARILYANQSMEKLYNSNFNQETLYQTLYQLGLIYAEYGPWSRAQEQFLEAFNQAPYHLEPLYELMAHYYFQGSYHVAYMFGLQGEDLANELRKYYRSQSKSQTEDEIDSEEEERLKPATYSFYNDQTIYDYKFYDVFSVVAGFVGDYENGKESARLAYQSAPEKEKERILKNFQLYENFLKVSPSPVAPVAADDKQYSTYYPPF